jgi:GNAT superfamily N-acetyltransferase
MKSDFGVNIRRPAKNEDWKRVREICCLTGNSGDPIDQERWLFFGELWVGPYQKLLPQWTYLAEIKGQVAGYLTGCPDTVLFIKWRALQFTIPLILRTLCGAYVYNSDVTRFVRRTLRLEKSPEGCFTQKTHEQLRSQYPAHLHINLDVSSRGYGIGRRLVEEFFCELRDLGVPGVHVFCGIKPVAFYQRLGFQELEKIEFRPGVWVYAMGYSLLHSI